MLVCRRLKLEVEVLSALPPVHARLNLQDINQILTLSAALRKPHVSEELYLFSLKNFMSDDQKKPEVLKYTEMDISDDILTSAYLCYAGGNYYLSLVGKDSVSPEYAIDYKNNFIKLLNIFINDSAREKR